MLINILKQETGWYILCNNNFKMMGQSLTKIGRFLNVCTIVNFLFNFPPPHFVLLLCLTCSQKINAFKYMVLNSHLLSSR